MRAMLMILSAAPAAMLAGCWDMPQCSNQEIWRADSPGGTMTAILFDRRCGGTTPDSAQLSIVPKGGSEPMSGNVFVASGGDVGTPPSPWVEARWLGPDRLLIRYDERANLYDRKPAIGKVAVGYESVRR